MNLDRRRFIAGTLMAAPALTSVKALARCYSPIQLGVQTYSFRDMLQTPGDMVDKMIAACKAAGFDMIELFEPTIQPPEFSKDAPWAMIDGKPTQASIFGKPPEGPPPASVIENRERIRQWRLNTDLSYFENIGSRFKDAGIAVQAFNFGLKEDCTDAEVERGFAIAKALGTGVITASTTIRMAQRSVPFFARHKVLLGLHGHSNLHDPNQFATPESFVEGLKMSPFYRINLDIGHFAAAGFDTVDFIEKHHECIVSLHIKDRKANEGANMPLGEGDTPVAATIRLLAEQRYRIPAIFEYEYAGADSVTELRRMKAYAEKILA